MVYLKELQKKKNLVALWYTENVESLLIYHNTRVNSNLIS